MMTSLPNWTSNRCLVLTINESREQTREIHVRQRMKQTLEGLLAEADRQHIIELHRNAQRLLKPVHVVNPYAEQLTFMDNRTRMRRDHMKYLVAVASELIKGLLSQGDIKNVSGDVFTMSIE
ncbi:hypothetical protein [Paraburkholderia phenoliruptrix]|uniref:hypothetical protein n=1 Tax=Paraburkholderia phenoliruptrix TaxID=252970 RepID=UPI001C6E47FA|nr:hypothetical protein [Paraburkholderia phenoliruptrix]MBW9104144.1 hypothetical protein [Paraburkholderia phenoliruptrix]MBW9130731.1 hypothetical protein [Paraburkholderia ginsengiterrae]